MDCGPAAYNQRIAPERGTGSYGSDSVYGPLAAPPVHNRASLMKSATAARCDQACTDYVRRRVRCLPTLTQGNPIRPAELGGRMTQEPRNPQTRHQHIHPQLQSLPGGSIDGGHHSGKPAH